MPLRLGESKRQFRGPGGVPLTIIGKITDAKLSHGTKTCIETVYVMENQKNSLLSKRACDILVLLYPSPEVYNIQGAPDFKTEYPTLFTGLGCLKTCYRITLKPGPGFFVCFLAVSTPKVGTW